MTARRSCSVGAFQSSFSKRTRPSAPTSTSTASMGSTYNFIADCGLRIADSLISNAGRGRGARRVVDAQYDGRRRTHFGSTAVRVLDVDVRVADETEDRRQTSRS